MRKSGLAGVLAGLWVLTAGVWGQGASGQKREVPPPAAPPMFAPDPVVHGDRTVTFTYTDATAKAVMLAIEGVRDPVAMQPDGAGKWTLTTLPLRPEWYGYHFEVDGQYALDAHNVVVKSGVLNAGNAFLVPGAQGGSGNAEPWEVAAVPHGEVHQHFFTTRVVKGLPLDQDHFVVYTPPGYDPAGTTRYPVLLSAAWMVGRGGRLDDGGPGERDSGQPDCGGEGEADDRGDADGIRGYELCVQGVGESGRSRRRSTIIRRCFSRAC